MVKRMILAGAMIVLCSAVMGANKSVNDTISISASNIGKVVEKTTTTSKGAERKTTYCAVRVNGKEYLATISKTVKEKCELAKELGINQPISLVVTKSGNARVITSK